MTIQFRTAASFFVGGAPLGLELADLNADGNLDLAVAITSEGAVALLAGLGEGDFGEEVLLEVGTGTSDVAIADFDGDGALDLAATTRFDNAIALLFAAGDGLFGTPQSVPIGVEPVALASGDFNNDGAPDLVAANILSSSLSVLINGGSTTTIAVGSAPEAVLAIDLDDDGNEDLVAANAGEDSLSLLFGDGDGGFSPADPLAVGPTPVDLASGDFNGDSIPDLAAANSGDDTVSVLLGDGGGGFATAQVFTVGERPQALVAADFDGDGNTDLATANFRGNNVSVLAGDGTGNFAAAIAFPAGNAPEAIAVGDVDSDGNSDLVVSNRGGQSVVVLLNDSETTAGSEPPVLNAIDSIALSETSDAGTVVLASLSATDDETPAEELTFAIASGNEAGLFAIAPETGEITLTEPLDFESQTRFTLGLVANDGEQNSAPVPLDIDLIDENDTAPEVAPFDPVTIPLNIAPEEVLATAAATDADTTGEELTYAIATGNEDGLFAIDAASGEISLTEAGIEAIAPGESFELAITASDGVNTSTPASLTLTVIASGTEPPELLPIEPASIIENAAPGTVVIASLAATDDFTPPEEITFAIASGNEDGVFAIAPETGEIALTETLDFESGPNRFAIGLVANDGEQNSAPVEVEISVLDANDIAPELAPFDPVTIPFATEPGQVLATAAATDADTTGEALTYAIASGNEDGLFAIEMDSGAISLTAAGVAAIAPGASFAIALTASDGVNTSTAQSLTAEVPETGTAPPELISLEPVSVTENSAPGTEIATLAATDDFTPSEEITFAIAAGNEAGLFAIAPEGTITLTETGAATLDFESEPQRFTLSAVANDGEQDSAPADIEIVLLDANDNPPEIAPLPPADIPEFAFPGFTVATIAASDVDTVGTLTYAIASGNEAGIFAIDSDSGRLTLAQTGDLAIGDTFELAITASDGANVSDPATLAITVSDSGQLVFGSTNRDRLDASDSRDRFDGTNEFVFAGGGADSIDASVENAAAANRIYGGTGDDELFASNRDRLFGGPGDDILDASAGRGDNRLYGGAGDDTFFAGSGDRFSGEGGSDRFFATSGGSNTFTGGAGPDRFWIANAEVPETPNTVTDFAIGEDAIGIVGLGPVQFANLDLRQEGSDTVVAFSGDDLAILSGIAALDLSASDFLLG